MTLPAPYNGPPRALTRHGRSLAVVLVLHGLAGWAALQLGVWRDRTPTLSAPPPILLWLMDEPRPPKAPAASPARTARSTAPLPTPATREPQAITLPALQAPPATTAPLSLPPPLASASAPPALLNLALPRSASAPWRQRPAALDDPRANTVASKSLEARLSAAIGGVGDQVVQERLADGTLRLRRGTDCVLVHPSLAGRIDPFSETFSPKARGVERC